VLVVDPSPAGRERTVALLSVLFEVESVPDAASGLAALARVRPHAICVAQDVGGLSGIELVRLLRERRRGVPIVLLMSAQRRLRDRLALEEAGVDACFEGPLDGKRLRLQIAGLVADYDPESDRLDVSEAALSGEAAGGAASPLAAVDADVQRFVARLEREATACDRDAVPFAVILIQRPRGRALPDLAPLLRERDSVCDRGSHALVLLAESREAGVERFRKRLREATGAPLPIVYRCFDRSGDGVAARSALGDWIARAPTRLPVTSRSTGS
jgi:CheY-like chemotaxis protein